MVSIEEILEMGSGYLLDLSHRTMELFFADYGIDLHEDHPDGSKATRMRDFLANADAAKIAQVLDGLLQMRGEREEDNESTHLKRYKQTVARLAGSNIAGPVDYNTDVISLSYASEKAALADRALADGDWEGAVTKARTLLEAVMVEIETRRKGRRGDHERTLQGQFTVVRKLLRIDEEREDLDVHFKTMIKGMVLVVEGIAPVRNKMGDGHASERVPAPHHARFVVNAAKTVSYFLVESYLYQEAKGMLPRGANE